ncbi:MAG TPA: pyrroline-5-carboxylate reductase, partial [Thermodesulfobacteriota bacterium]|nr:pyrroline-5-carboxylate reductase [Thermodesulfobacteriota bacterium]
KKTKMIGFIGAGNMSEALIAGLLKAKFAPPGWIMAFDTDGERLQFVCKKHGIKRASDNDHLASNCDPLLLCVKPQSMREVIEGIADSLDASKLLISIAAGVSLQVIETYARKQLRSIRVMPNINVLVQEGASAIAPGELATEEDLKLTKTIFDCVGRSIIVQEPLMDAVTGLSGSGPAYTFLIVEALTDAGVHLGMTRSQAFTLVTQTMMGSVKLLLDTGEHPALLREKVTSPGGTTAAGLYKLEEGGLRKTLIDAVIAATRRSKDLGDKMKS